MNAVSLTLVNCPQISQIFADITLLPFAAVVGVLPLLVF
jgi:hypothetical protein